MSDGIIPTPEFNEQLKRTVRETLRRDRSPQKAAQRFHRKGLQTAIVQLTEDLDPATAFDDSPATAVANVLVRDASTGNLIRKTVSASAVTLTVTNRYEHWDTIPANTFGWVMRMNNEWWPGDFDCDAAAGGLLS